MNARFLGASVICLSLFGCGSVKEERVILSEPEAATADGKHPNFHLVEDAIAKHCATLDCHGQVGRNFRFYWQRGLRLNGIPGDNDTTDDEYEATYRSLIALEPFIMDAVVNGKAPPTALTLVRKARGMENHKGAAQLEVGSNADRCLVQWLVGAFDADACKNAAKE
ncbi:MAG: hypothetical protein ACXVEF_37465 [Polyangiales bacterium]